MKLVANEGAEELPWSRAKSRNGWWRGARARSHRANGRQRGELFQSFAGNDI